MDKQQVMFVETEGQILNHLKSGLVNRHSDWKILFMSDARAAVELVSQRQVDVVLASFGEDHASCEEFFNSLRKRAPKAIRIGLLPKQSSEIIVESLRYAHTCIAAHCDPSQIEDTVTRGLYVREKMHGNPQLAQLMSNLDTIPTPPAIYFDIRDEMESPNGTADSIAEIISRDPAMAAKLLRMANSGFYGVPRTVANISEAVNLLGMDLLLALVLSAHLYSQLPLPGLKLDELWKHSVAVATLARELASQAQGGQATISICTISGLLHDLGQLVFLANMPDIYYTLIRDARGNESKLLELELAEFGVGHPELAALILSLWGLPEEVVQTIASHHRNDFPQLPDIPLATRAVCAAESMLQSYSLNEPTEFTNSDEQARVSWMFDSLVQLEPLMEKLVDQGVIPARKRGQSLMG